MSPADCAPDRPEEWRRCRRCGDLVLSRDCPCYCEDCFWLPPDPEEEEAPRE